MSKKTLSGVYYELNGDGYQKHKNAQISFPKASNDKESPRAFSLPVIKEHETPESHKS